MKFRDIAVGFLSLALIAGCHRPASPDIAHGHRLATVLGCISCHGPKMDGHLFQDEPGVAKIYSANASRILPTYSDVALRRMLVTGRRRDGIALWVMPPAAFAVLNTGDMRDLIGWLRTVPPTGPLHPPIHIGPLWQKAIDSGQIKPPSATLAQELANPPVDLGPRHARGRYLARIACAECHEPDLAGEHDPQPGDAPSLDIAASYDAVAFRRLLRTGRGMTRANLGLMTEAARERLHALGDADITAIHDYLVARSQQRSASLAH